MATVTDEDILELVERFDVPLEDTYDIERLQKALAEKLEAAGVPYVSGDFLSKFQEGIDLRFEMLPKALVSSATYFRPSVPAHPGGFHQHVYRDVTTGRWISPTVVSERLKGLRP